MNRIEEYVRSHKFADLTASQIAEAIFNSCGAELSPISIGRFLMKLISKKVVSRRILDGCYLYTSHAVQEPPAPPAPPPAPPPPSLTVQTATPVTLNTVQFSSAYATPYEPDEKYGEIQAALDASLTKNDDYKSLNVKLYNALLKAEKERHAYVDFLTYLSDKLSTLP